MQKIMKIYIMVVIIILITYIICFIFFINPSNYSSQNSNILIGLMIVLIVVSFLFKDKLRKMDHLKKIKDVRTEYVIKLHEAQENYKRKKVIKKET